MSTLEAKLLSLFFFASFVFVIDIDCKISRATFSVDVYIDYTLTIFILKTSYQLQDHIICETVKLIFVQSAYLYICIDRFNET